MAIRAPDGAKNVGVLLRKCKKKSCEELSKEGILKTYFFSATIHSL